MKGGTLRLVMGDNPYPSRGSRPKDLVRRLL